jgi:hypothetical protein
MVKEKEKPISSGFQKIFIFIFTFLNKNQLKKVA